MRSFVKLSLFMAVLVAICPSRAISSPADDDVQLQVRQLRQQMDQQQQFISQMRHRLEQVEQENAVLRRQTEQGWLNQRRAEEVKTLIREVLADSETRASLLDSDLTAGWKNGFFLASADGQFSLRILGMIQVRYTHGFQNNSADPLDDASPDDSRGGFGITRTRFGFLGHIVDPSWTFLLWSGYDCSGNAVVLDAYITKHFDGPWSLTAGQFKLPFQYEYLVSETRQQFIDRTLIAGEFCGTYTQGLMATYQTDYLKIDGSINDGASTINTIWYKRLNQPVALTGRAAWKLTGDWKDYADWEGFPGQDTLVVLAGAVHWEKGEYGTDDNNEVDSLRWTVDASAEFAGANLFAAVVGDHMNSDAGPEIERIACMVQGGYFLTEKLEGIARYEWGDSDQIGETNLSILTVGMNYFVRKHALKISTDVGYAFDPVATTWVANPLGYRLDSAGGNGQVVWRAQIQLIF